MSVKTDTPARDDGGMSGLRAAVAEDLLTLAVLHDRELDRSRLLALWNIGYEDFLSLGLRSPAGRAALQLFRQGLTDIPGALDPATLDLLAAEYADIYLNNGYRASPCESVWIDEDGLMMQEPMFQIREAYRRYGLQVADWRKRSDDHLVHQLHFLALVLGENDSRQALENAARFMDEHLLRWIGGFADKIASRCASRLYAGLARLTAAYADELRDLLAEILQQARPTPQAIDARMQPKRSLSVAAPAPFVPGAAPSW